MITKQDASFDAESNERRPLWRSLSQLEGTKEFEEFVHREFPQAASEFPQGVSRRRWLQLMGASFSLAVVSGCRWEAEDILPMATRAPQRVPGETQAIATSIELGGVPRHLVVTCFDGRPTKVEGNSLHPDSRGATDMMSQAAVLDLYDPDRSATIRQTTARQTFRRDWGDFERWLEKIRGSLAEKQGENAAIILAPSHSPTRKKLLDSLRVELPKLRVYEHTSVPCGRSEDGTQIAFGEALAANYDVTQARVLFCLDDDLLIKHPASLRHTREFSGRRDPEKKWMNRLYVAESQFSLTGTMADHRLAVRSGAVPDLLDKLEAAISDDSPAPDHLKEASKEDRFVSALADDLRKYQGRCLITLGEHHSPEMHARVHALNVRLGNAGKTVTYHRVHQKERSGIREFVSAVEKGQIGVAFVLGCNPVYSAPAGVDVASALGKVETTVHLGRYLDETGELCEWHLPQAHPFETWGDVRTSTGLYSVSQPLIDPLLNGKSEIEILALLAGEVDFNAEAGVKATCEQIHGESLSGKQWRKTLHDGLLEDSELPVVNPSVKMPLPTLRSPVVASPANAIELVFTASDTVFDGSFANNSWLQETPDHLTKLTWDNAALVNPATAERLGLRHGHLAKVVVGGREIQAPVFVLPGQAENSIGLALGYGRTAAGSVGGHLSRDVTSVGVNVNPLRPEGQWVVDDDVSLTPTNVAYELATTQDHHAIDTQGLEEIGHRVGELVREGSLSDYESNSDFAQDHHDSEALPLWEEPSYEGHAWGMSIDLNKCIGCNACLVACQSENNVPVVGKDQVLKGREMHWIRTDRYFVGEPEDPEVAHQVVTCQHCENAPCEQVCPVAATVHSDEGLNDMVYNRCVGTRYCANNCPYKVRRFNFFDYNEELSEPGNELIQLGVNPEVTVRSRGVMEKCTYCVQRIQAVKIDAKSDSRPIRDGELKTACQQACPAQAIEFGDLNDPASGVSKAHANGRAYKLLGELNVKPRTAYLARIRNPHPWLADDESAAGEKEETHS